MVTWLMLTTMCVVTSHRPGAYNTDKSAVMRKSQAMDPQAFNNTARRFGPDDNGVPGPGDYAPDHAINLAKAVADKNAISKGGVFGTNSIRYV